MIFGTLTLMVILMGNLCSLTKSVNLRRGFGFASTQTNPIQLIYDSLVSLKSADIQSAITDPAKSKALSRCLTAMNDITLPLIGIQREFANNFQENTCMNVCYDQNFNVAIFLIPKGATLPLHDHPHMTVLSKIVHGELFMKSFTKKEGGTETSDSFPAILSQETVKTSADAAWFLTPTGDWLIHFLYIHFCPPTMHVNKKWLHFIGLSNHFKTNFYWQMKTFMNLRQGQIVLCSTSWCHHTRNRNALATTTPVKLMKQEIGRSRFSQNPWKACLTEFSIEDLFRKQIGKHFSDFVQPWSLNYTGMLDVSRNVLSGM